MDLNIQQKKSLSIARSIKSSTTNSGVHFDTKTETIKDQKSLKAANDVHNMVKKHNQNPKALIKIIGSRIELDIQETEFKKGKRIELETYKIVEDFVFEIDLSCHIIQVNSTYFDKEADIVSKNYIENNQSLELLQNLNTNFEPLIKKLESQIRHCGYKFDLAINVIINNTNLFCPKHKKIFLRMSQQLDNLVLISTFDLNVSTDYIFDKYEDYIVDAIEDLTF